MLANEDTVKATIPARIMDFSEWLAAFEIVAGLKPEALQKAYQKNVTELSASGVEHDSLTVALETLIMERCRQKPWKGTPSALLSLLQQYEQTSYLPRGPVLH